MFTRPIICVGDLVADVVVHIQRLPVEENQHQWAREMGVEPGGGGNFLIVGARLGAPMMALGALGDDVWGRQVASALKDEGVDMSCVLHRGATVVVLALIASTPDNSEGGHVFLVRDSEGELSPLPHGWRECVAEAAAVFVAGYSLLESRMTGITVSVVDAARSHSVPIFFDPGPPYGDLSPALQRTSLALSDVILLTEEELETVLHKKVSELLETAQLVVVKRGADGCVVYPRDGAPIRAPGYPVKAVDTTGAGDSFDAAFIAALTGGWDLADCARLANAVGAAKVEKLGSGRAVPTLEEVGNIIARFNIPISFE